MIFDKIVIFFKAIYFSFRYGPSCFNYCSGKRIHYKTEYITKINSISIAKDIFKFRILSNKSLEHKLAYKNYLIWSMKEMTCPFIHFCILYEYNYEKIYSDTFGKSNKKTKIRNKLRILRTLSLIYLVYKIALRVLINTKLDYMNYKVSNKIISNENISKPRFAFLAVGLLDQFSRGDFFLYDQLEKFGLSYNEPIVVFNENTPLTKNDIKFNHPSGYIFCEIPKINILVILLTIKIIIRNIISRKKIYLLYNIFYISFLRIDSYIKSKTLENNIKLFRMNNWGAVNHIFNFSISNSGINTTVLTRERSVVDIIDTWSRDYISTKLYLSFYKREKIYGAIYDKNIFLPYRINQANYKKYSSNNTNVKSCTKRFLFFTSNMSSNEDPFGFQLIHKDYMKLILNQIAIFLSLNPKIGIVFKSKKSPEYRYIYNWIYKNPEFNNQVDIISPSLSIPLVDLTNSYHDFIAITPHSSASSLFELSALIPKNKLHFIDTTNYYEHKYFSNSLTRKDHLESLPFNIYKNFNQFLNTIDLEDLSLISSIELDEYNRKVNDNLLSLEDYIKNQKIC